MRQSEEQIDFILRSVGIDKNRERMALLLLAAYYTRGDFQHCYAADGTCGAFSISPTVHGEVQLDGPGHEEAQVKQAQRAYRDMMAIAKLSRIEIGISPGAEPVWEMDIDGNPYGFQEWIDSGQEWSACPPVARELARLVDWLTIIQAAWFRPVKAGKTTHHKSGWTVNSTDFLTDMGETVESAERARKLVDSIVRSSPAHLWWVDVPKGEVDPGTGDVARAGWDLPWWASAILIVALGFGAVHFAKNAGRVLGGRV